MPWSNLAGTLQLLSWSPKARELQLLKPMHPRARAPKQEKPLRGEAWTPHLKSSPGPLQLEKSPCRNEDPAQPQMIKLGGKGPHEKKINK